MAPTYTPEDARPYVDGFDRSASDVAHAFLADHPDGDPRTFLVEALGLELDAADEAVKALEAFLDGAESSDVVDDGQGDDDAGQAPAPADAGEPDRAATKAELLERAAELGVQVDARWGIDRIREAVDAAAAARG